MRNRVSIEKMSKGSVQGKMQWGNLLENVFVVVLAFYPLRHINWGLDLWDTGYNYANFQYMGTDHMDPMWLFSTYLANVVGHFLSGLGGGGTLSGMNLYTGMFVSLLALTGFFFCTKVLQLPSGIAFVGELVAVSLCWCPTALLYNYLTYLFLMACVILLYIGLMKEKKWCLFGAGVCLGVNVLVRFSNLPEMALILAVWAYDVILEWEIKKAGRDKPESFWRRIGRHTLWCLLGYLAALLVLFLGIHMNYGIGAYVEGIRRLFAMTDNATDYKATSMLLGMLHIYVDHLYWVIRIGVILVGGIVLLLLARLLRDFLDRLVERLEESGTKRGADGASVAGRVYDINAISDAGGVHDISAISNAGGVHDGRRDSRERGCPDAKGKRFELGLRIFMGLLGLAIGGWLYHVGFWTLLSQGELVVRQLTVQQFGMLSMGLVMAFALTYCAGERLSAVLIGMVMLGWLYLKEFCSPMYYSYDSILRPGVLFLMLAMLIGLIRIVHPECPREEKLISGTVILLLLITSIGSNNGIYPSLNNLFLAAPYTFWQCWRFLRNVGDGQLGKLRLSVWPAKGLLVAFLVMCLLQFGAFGVVFVFAEATGVQNADSYVENNAVLRGIRMSADKAQWMSSLSAYVNENGLQGQEVILYGRIPSLSYYLQMPSAFNPWSDLDSYSLEQMTLQLEETAAIVENGGDCPVVILEQKFAVYLNEGKDALAELGVGEENVLAIERDKKWAVLQEFMEEQGYELVFDNGKFALYR